MKEHIVQCRVCKEKFDTNKYEEGDEWIMPSRNWYYHTSCYTEWIRKANLSVTDEHTSEVWRSALWDYIYKECRLPNINFAKVENQWKNFLKQGRTPKGIYFAVRYFYEVEHGDIDKAQGGIGIVKHVYNRSAQYWSEQAKRNKGLLENIEAQIKEQQIMKIITVNRNKSQRKKKLLTFEEVEI